MAGELRHASIQTTHCFFLHLLCNKIPHTDVCRALIGQALCNLHLWRYLYAKYMKVHVFAQVICKCIQ